MLWTAYSLNYTPTTVGDQSWKETILGGGGVSEGDRRRKPVNHGIWPLWLLFIFKHDAVKAHEVKVSLSLFLISAANGGASSVSLFRALEFAPVSTE
jgi:hypothetical protein